LPILEFEASYVAACRLLDPDDISNDVMHAEAADCVMPQQAGKLPRIEMVGVVRHAGIFGMGDQLRGEASIAQRALERIKVPLTVVGVIEGRPGIRFRNGPRMERLNKAGYEHFR